MSIAIDKDVDRTRWIGTNAIEARPRYLNIGCGNRFHPGWINLDMQPRHPSVIRLDAGKPLPFPDDHFNIVYHSHVLEHIPRNEVPGFLSECRRVLKPGGLLRVAVPNLEEIARLYVRALDESIRGDPQWQERYEWILLELLDQVARHRSGGLMLEYLLRDPPPALDFVLERIGAEAKPILAWARQNRARSPKPSWKARVRRFFDSFRPGKLRESWLRIVLGNEYKSLQLGRFRRGGEVHVWMYDRYSLPRLLSGMGFEGAQAMGPMESHCAGWAGFHLDSEPDGTTYKPDSLFVEAIKAVTNGR